MATKLKKSTFPDGHGENDLKCFGPAATKDGQFDDNMICDMGFFGQDEKDSNKYYHAAIVQSTKDNQWYTYFEWGRQGAGRPQFLFTLCSGKDEAQQVYAKQLHAKNDKRGQWVNDATLGTVLRPKPGKDCYLVRPQATRSTGLPDAKTITTTDGDPPKKKTVKKGKKGKKKSPVTDNITVKLMRDLNVGTVNYTRSQMADQALPTQAAIDEARALLNEAIKRVNSVGDSVDDQINDSDLKQLTYTLYSRIPKNKARGAQPVDWILSQDNIQSWQFDLDAFESALVATDLGDDVDYDPFGGMRIKMHHLSAKDPTGEFIREWMPLASRNRHRSLSGPPKIQNVWSVERVGDSEALAKEQNRIAQEKWKAKDGPLHQPTQRPDLQGEQVDLFRNSGTHMMFHGTRSVNVSGILREALRFPKDLVGVVITGAMFGGGHYWADDWKKSAGYTSLSSAYWNSGGGGSVPGRGAFMFIADVALGNPYVAPESKGYRQPPSGFHSVMGKGGFSGGGWGKLANNEFVTYRPKQNRLRYLVEFTMGR